MSSIIIGVDERPPAEDAIAFGGSLARQSGAAVTVAHAYPWRHTGLAGTYEYNQYLLEQSDTLLARMSEPLRDLPDVETRSLAEPSAARALHELAEELHAGLIVVGSSHTSRMGRVLPGSTAERLLHGSPCPVAVVPKGFRPEPDGAGVIACAWDGTPESDAALAAAEELARTSSATLRVIRVFEPTLNAYPPALDIDAQFTADGRGRAQRALAERLDHLGADVTIEAVLLEGPAAHELIGASDAADLMIVGSRGYGPLQAVLLGGVTGTLVRSAGCPVIVVPNGARTAVASVFKPNAVQAAH